MRICPSKLTFQVTTRCDKGCRICFANSKKKAPSLPFRTIQNVLGQLPLTVPVAFTGGEPFLYQDGSYDLADLVALAGPDPRPVSLISSGWEPGEGTYDFVFSRLVKHFPALEIGTSFNLYQKAGIEGRVKALLQLVMAHGGNSWINVVVSQSTAGPTFRRLWRMLRELSLTPADPQAMRRWSTGDTDVSMTFHSQTGQRVLVEPMKLQAAGRARGLSEPLFVDNEDCGFLKGEYRMVVSVKGDVYMCESPSTMDGPGLGNITREAVNDVLSKFDPFRVSLSSALQVGRYRYPDICQACITLRSQALEMVHQTPGQFG